MSPIQPGTELAGKYRIEQVLAQGGMGVVVMAHHLRLDERVAIKFLLPACLEIPEAVARFDREARAAAKIRSEHSVRVRDIGTLEWGAPYMVMEYLEGNDLYGVLTQRGRLPLAEALDYFLQGCEAIAEAHSLGIVHRDLKPANLFLSRRADGSTCVKVLDFGISKFSSGDSSQSAPDFGMTQAATVLGSPYYMSPEQLNSARDVDARTDVWALGVILYEMLTGKRPFEADSLPGLGVAIATQAPEPWPSDLPSIPQGLIDVVMDCLTKDRNLRLQSVGELATRLRPFAPQEAILSVERILRVAEGGNVVHSSYPPTALHETNPTPHPAQTHRTHWGFSRTGTSGVNRTRLALLGIGIAVAVAAVAFALLRKPAPVTAVGASSADALSAATVLVQAASADSPEIVPILEANAVPAASEPSSPAATQPPKLPLAAKLPAQGGQARAASSQSESKPPPNSLPQKTSNVLGGRL